MKPQYIKIDEDGHKFYYSDREMQTFHREDGPAVEYSNGSKSWYWNGQRHREDGPAFEWANGYKSWYLNDQKLSEAEHCVQLLKALSEAEHARRTAKETVLTMDEIAVKFGVDVSKLKITK